MKKLLVVLSLAMAALSFQAGAATFSLINLSNGNVDIGPNLVADSQHVSKTFTTAWEFGSDTDGSAVVAITGNPDFIANRKTRQRSENVFIEILYTGNSDSCDFIMFWIAVINQLFIFASHYYLRETPE